MTFLKVFFAVALYCVVGMFQSVNAQTYDVQLKLDYGATAAKLTIINTGNYAFTADFIIIQDEIMGMTQAGTTAAGGTSVIDIPYTDGTPAMICVQIRSAHTRCTYPTGRQCFVRE